MKETKENWTQRATNLRWCASPVVRSNQLSHQAGYKDSSKSLPTNLSSLLKLVVGKELLIRDAFEVKDLLDDGAALENLQIDPDADILTVVLARVRPGATDETLLTLVQCELLQLTVHPL